MNDNENKEHILPRTRAEWVKFTRNLVLVLAMFGSAYSGTEAANESRLDRLEATVQRIEYQLDKVIQTQADDNK